MEISRQVDSLGCVLAAAAGGAYLLVMKAVHEETAVLFLHGLESSPSGSKARHLSARYDAFTPALPTRDLAASIEVAREAIREHAPAVVVGSSFGGAVLLALVSDGGYRGASIFIAQAGKLFATGAALPRDARAILIHGDADAVVPIEGSRALAASGGPGVELVEIAGGDHRLERILADGTLDRAVTRLLEEPSDCGRALGGDVDTCTLERAARSFATSRHAGQRYGDGPYVRHLRAVRAVLADVDAEPDLAVAAWLHDTVEDTSTSREDIASRFGEPAAALVWAVTGVGRDRVERNHAAYAKIRALPRAATLKLADRIANVEASKNVPTKLEMYRAEWDGFSSALAGLGDSRLWSRLRTAIGASV